MGSYSYTTGRPLAGSRPHLQTQEILGSTLHPRLATTYTDNGYIQPYQMCMCMYMQALYIYIYIYMSGRLPPGRLTNMYMYNNERS